MPIWTNASEEKLDTSSSFDLLLVCDTLGFQIRRITVQDVDVRWIYINVREKVLVHEGMVRFWVLAWQAHVLVLSNVCQHGDPVAYAVQVTHHVERDHILE